MTQKKAEEGLLSEVDEDELVPVPGQYFEAPPGEDEEEGEEEDEFERLSGDRFREEKAAILGKIVPISLVPMSTANLLLVMGSNGVRRVDRERSCDFELPAALLITGIVSTAMVLMGVVAENILEWIVENRTITLIEQCIIAFLNRIGNVLAAIQLCILLAGTYLAGSMAAGWQYTDKSKDHYCDYGITIFAAVLLSVTWFFVLYAAGAYVYIKCIVKSE